MNAIRCPHCGKMHSTAAEFCPHTGKSLEGAHATKPPPTGTVRNRGGCPHCGQTHAATAQFCPVTGKALQSRVTRKTPVPPSTRESPWTMLLYGGGILAIIIAAAALMQRVGQPQESRLPTTINTSEPVRPPATSTASGPSTAVPVQGSTTASSPATFAQAPNALPSPGAATTQNSRDGSESILVPAGSFLMGSDPAKDPYFWGAESPEHTVTLNAFRIYRTEVTQGMYKKCVLDGACQVPEVNDNAVAHQYGNAAFDAYPVVMVTWGDAQAYCNWAGARLPTEAEWEKAARGTDGRLFPWGNDPNPDGRANFQTSAPSAVGSFPAGASPYGALDMAGNVLEWVNDYMDSSYYQHSPADNPRGRATGTRRVIRGGAFIQDEIGGIRTVARASLEPGDTYISVGFRCAMDGQ